MSRTSTEVYEASITASERTQGFHGAQTPISTSLDQSSEHLAVDAQHAQPTQRGSSVREDDSSDNTLEQRISARHTATFGETLEPRIAKRNGDELTLHRVVSPTNVPPGSIELGRIASAQHSDPHATQGLPTELPNLLSEFIFIAICSTGQLLFSSLLGSFTVNQVTLVSALDITTAQTPWLIGATLLANGLSVIVSGSLADLASPKLLMVGAFAWLTAWSIVGAFSVQPSRRILFFVVRAAQGLAVGTLVSASMSILGRIYKPGVRKTRVFSGMAAMSPFGFWLGTLQGGALSSHLPWVFASTAILTAYCCIAAQLIIPPLSPAADQATGTKPSLKDFDYPGALAAVTSCALLLAGLTQGTPANWSPYTYVLIIAGILLLGVFYLCERRAPRPLLPNHLWRTPGFTPLVVSYFLGFGAFVGAWQFFAVRFWLSIQHASPLTVALYLTPNAIVGVLATFIVARSLHLVAGHWILTASMVAYALGPTFFLPQTPGSSYWALGMPGVALVTFGPDLSFAAASVFVTSSVRRSDQGAAGSLLVTVQNLSAAVGTAVGEAIGSRVSGGEGDLTLEGLRAAWWCSMGMSLAAVVVCVGFVRIPKSEEKEHVS